MAMLAAFSLVGLFLLVLGMFVLRRVARAFFAVRGATPAPKPSTCVCGYPLIELDRPRCPECGRVASFNATAEELGLSDEELQKIAAAQKRRESERIARAKPE